MLIAILFLTLLSLAVSVLALSSVGHLHTRIAGVQASEFATFSEVQTQARVTRKALLEVLNEKVLPAVGYEEPEPTELEKAMRALSRGEEPVIDFSQLKAGSWQNITQ